MCADVMIPGDVVAIRRFRRLSAQGIVATGQFPEYSLRVSMSRSNSIRITEKPGFTFVAPSLGTVLGIVGATSAAKRYWSHLVSLGANGTTTRVISLTGGDICFVAGDQNIRWGFPVTNSC